MAHLEIEAEAITTEDKKWLSSPRQSGPQARCL